MQVWKWNAANNAFTTVIPARDADLLSGVFTADGTPRTWSTPPQVVPGIEKDPKKQKPFADISFVMGASLVLNDNAHAALADFLAPFGQFLELEMLDETGLAGGNQRLHFFNVTNVVPCIDLDRSQLEGKKVIHPAFIAEAVPSAAQVFKDPLRKKMDIYLNEAAHDEVVRRMTRSGITGSTLTRLA
jgi:hypothetical protein